MKRLMVLIALCLLLTGTMTALADDGKTTPVVDPPKPAEQSQTPDQTLAADPVKYELGALRILVYDHAKKTADRAVVYVNDIKKDNSPVFLEGLKPGDYAVRVVAPKASWSGTVTVEAGKTAGLDVTLDKNKASADLYEVLLWEDFLDNRNSWQLKPGSTIVNGSLIAKTDKEFDYFNESDHTFQDFSIEANLRIKQKNNVGTNSFNNYNGPMVNIPDATFGFVLRAKGSATLLLFESSGGSIDRYYLVTFDDLEYYTRPIVLVGEMKAQIKDEFRVKALLRHEELQIFVDGKLAAISQVKYTNEGNIGVAIGPGLTVEMENVTVGKV